MKISEVNIEIIKPKNGLVAFASFVWDDVFYMSSVGVHQKLDGDYRLTYPTKKVGSRDLDIYHPLQKNVSKTIEKAVIKKVRKLFNEKESIY